MVLIRGWPCLKTSLAVLHDFLFIISKFDVTSSSCTKEGNKNILITPGMFCMNKENKNEVHLKQNVNLNHYDEKLKAVCYFKTHQVQTKGLKSIRKPIS